MNPSQPELFGRYRLLRRLGAGGMGAVYLAEDTVLRRKVAIKRPSFQGTSEEIIVRFHREARVAARISHPNLCPVLDVGQIEDQHYLTMPYIEGKPLSDLIQPQSPWPTEKAARLVFKLAGALSLLHQRGVIHRDLKPGNVLLRADGEPVVVDFGLARAYKGSGPSRETAPHPAPNGTTKEGDRGPATSRGPEPEGTLTSLGRLTATGIILGTPAYLSPEQGAGAADQGPSTDIYGLGAILYELFTGRPPFVGKTMDSLYSWIESGAPPRPSEICQHLGVQEDQLVMKALAREPGERYSSMEDFALALDYYLHQEPTIPSPQESRSLKQGIQGPPKPLEEQDPGEGELLGGSRGAGTPASKNTRSFPQGVALKEQPQRQQGSSSPALAPTKGTFPLATSPGGTFLSTLESPPSTAVRKKRPVLGVLALVLVLGAAVGILVKLAWRDANQFDGGTLQAPPLAVVLEVPLAGEHTEQTLPKIILQGVEKRTLGVRITRNNCPGPVEMRFAGLPGGLKALPCFIPVGSNEGRLTLVVEGVVAPGRYPVQLRALAANAQAEQSVVIEALPDLPVREGFALSPVLPVGLRTGATRSVRVHLQRKNHEGPVRLRAEGLPHGVTAHPITLPPGDSEGLFTFTASGDVPPQRKKVQLQALAGNQKVEVTVDLLLTQVITTSFGMELVVVPAGSFTMGSPPGGEKDRDHDEGPLHEVTITRPFLMGIYEVTQEQFEKVMGYNPSHFSAHGKGNKEISYDSASLPGKGYQSQGGPGPNTSRFPVENVTWEEALAFCEKLSQLPEEKSCGRVYRLPTEAEWEYACREAGVSDRPFHWGRTLTSHQANFNGTLPYGTRTRGPYLARTVTVGSYQPSALGLYDMHGNVWEWCLDSYESEYYRTCPKQDPRCDARGSYRVLRGGAWFYHGVYCRAAERFRAKKDSPGRTVGFRVVALGGTARKRP